MKFLTRQLLVALIPLALCGCSTFASASEGAWQATVFTSEGGNAGGPIRARSLNLSTGELGSDQVQGPSELFFGDLLPHPIYPWLLATEGNLRLHLLRVSGGSLLKVSEAEIVGRAESDDELVITPDGQFVYLCHNDRISPFHLSSDGHLERLQPFVQPGAVDLNNGIIDRSGQLLYVADRNQGRIWAYRIGSDGLLTAISAEPTAAVVGGTLRRLLVDDSNHFLLALDDSSDQVLVYRIGSHGNLEANGAKSVGSSQQSHSDMSLRGSMLLVAEGESAQLQVYTLDEAGGLAPQGFFAHGGSLVSSHPRTPYVLAARNVGDFAVASQRFHGEHNLEIVQQQSSPKASLDLEVVVYRSNP